MYYFVAECKIEHEDKIDRESSNQNYERDHLKSDIHEVKLCLLKIFRLHNMLINISQNDYLHHIEKSTIRFLHSQSVDWYTTICGKCNSNCHEKCLLNETGDTFGCEVIQSDDGLCNHCTQLCGYSDHYHNRKKIQLVTKSMKEVLSDLALRVHNDKIDDGYLILRRAMEHQLDDIKMKIINFVNKENNIDIVDEIIFPLQQLSIETHQLQDSKEKITYQKLIDQLLFSLQQDYISQSM